MAFGVRRGSAGEIRVGRVRALAVRVGAWTIVDGVLEGRVVDVVDPFHALAGEGVFRTRWGKGTLEIPVRGDLRSGVLSVGETQRNEKDV